MKQFRHSYEIDKNPRNNNITNLLTLCRDCHGEAHSLYNKFITK